MKNILFCYNSTCFFETDYLGYKTVLIDNALCEEMSY